MSAALFAPVAGPVTARPVHEYLVSAHLFSNLYTGRINEAGANIVQPVASKQE
jgi:hypothetical protein